MILENRIWEELKQAHINIKTIEWYTDRQRKKNRICNFIIALSASVGALGNSLHEYVSFVCCLIIGVISITKPLFSQFMQSEKDLRILDSLMDYYTGYMNELEILFYKLRSELSEDNAIKEFYLLKKNDSNKQSQLNRLIFHIPKRVMKKLTAKSDEYLKRVYYNIYEHDNFQKDTNEQ